MQMDSAVKQGEKSLLLSISSDNHWPLFKVHGWTPHGSTTVHCVQVYGDVNEAFILTELHRPEETTVCVCGTFQTTEWNELNLLSVKAQQRQDLDLKKSPDIFVQICS